MRLVSFENEQGMATAGALVGARVIDLHATNPKLPRSVRELLAQGPEWLAEAERTSHRPDAIVVESPRLLAPIPDPQKVICIGLNYQDHAEESGAPIPADPVVFNKFPTSVIGPDDPIVLPRASDQVDYEAELVVVMGRRCKNVAVASAMDYVAGYTIGHDVSARDWQLKKDGKQWLMGKTFDSFAPMGPALVTKDEIADPHGLAISFRLNSQVMQSSSTARLIFRIDRVVSYLSQVFTLLPGDVIFTGTPAGVGFTRKPPVFLKPGDVCEVEIEGLGVLSNRCVAE